VAGGSAAEMVIFDAVVLDAGEAGLSVAQPVVTTAKARNNPAKPSNPKI
jgi:hypothetical protein